MTDTQVKTKKEVEVFKEYSSRLSPANMALLDSLLNTVAALVAMSKERVKGVNEDDGRKKRKTA